MKTVFNLFAPVAILVMLVATSCKKFIKEELVTTLTEDYYKTDAGIEDLIKSAYVPLRWKFEGEQAYALWNFGVDEFRLGDQFNSEHFNTYNSNLNSNGNDGFLNGLWINYYAGINRCNLGIDYVSSFSDAASTRLGAQTQRNLRIAELKFLRAFYYFTLVQQFGGVPLVVDPPKEARSEFPRASVAQVYEQIMADFRAAGPALPWKAGGEPGRASRAAAYHFLAKAYLTRGSAVTEVRGQKPTDMDSAIVFADSVIRFSGHALESNFGNLFNAAYANHQVPAVGSDGTPPSGSVATINANNNSNEIIFAAQFSQNLALASSQNNQTHLYFITQYDAGIAIPGMTRDFFNGRPFRRLRPTDYTIDIFDWQNDSRFFKTFQTVYYRNVASNTGLPTFTAANAPSPDLIGKPRVGIGDTAALFIVNKPSQALLTTDIDRFRYYRTYVRYKRANPTAPITSDWNDNKYLSMIKFLDPVRLTNTANEARGIRNGTLARLAETYLVLAEAYGRKGDFANALVNINIIRTRAAYKAGEPKNPHNWLVYGQPYNDLSSTAPAMQATTALFTTNAPSELYPATTANRFVEFMLNERTRELCGELYRWEDLARTETFFNRTKAFNPDATNVAPYHKLRPIPLPQIISQTKGGRPLTSGDISSYQNSGY
ncbi:RagB/SusD family nutrient uptake outer membrane protein [Segetibacter sp. 3557_3]|uniref:RagB/SusD family nutrient uptake outer membrane protein n=1 Tax=Segetibacter sp. 3557_3 TaxID=2547429 RepID=UPI0010585D1C|nr:RagB/SusD family nutrient uptake outer membrane protein [Segetibacter sp. 3557_3]TDH21379.1 RagB/SusD family nutrient uptake outer membrane protein [Segetibacter sp. 3557_3]